MEFKIANRFIGSGHPAFIVAELSCNHLQDYKLAQKTIRAIKEAGADAVKMQTFTPDTMTIRSREKYFRIKNRTLWDGKTLYQLYQQAFMPWHWQPKLKKLSEDLGLVCFSTPFDKSAVDFLEKIKVPVYKIASFEITDIPLIEYVAAKGRPILISTGIAQKADIQAALAACARYKNRKIALLKCTSDYPASFKDINLKTIPDMAKRFKTVVGLSDHSPGISVAVAAAVLGAKIIEKHFILNRKLGGPDAAFSLEPQEFRAMVKSIREIEASLGKISYGLSARLKKNRIFCRSLFAVEDIRPLGKITPKNTRSIRPGYGLAPKFLKAILGKRVKKYIKKGTPLSWNLIIKN